MDSREDAELVFFRADNTEPSTLTDGQIIVKPGQMLTNNPTEAATIVHTSIYKFRYKTRLVSQHFLVFNTCDGLWWSVEKKPSGILIQRSEIKEAVVNSVKQQTRSNCVEIKSTKEGGSRSIVDVIALLGSNNYVFQGYDIQYNNCMMFTKYIFDKVAKYDTFEIGSNVTSFIHEVKILARKPFASLYGEVIKTKWRPVLYFDKCAESSDPSTKGEFTNEEILRELRLELVNNPAAKSSEDEVVEIIEIGVYTTPLEGVYSSSPKIVQNAIGKQWTCVDYHAFVAFRTSDGGWWSLEKNQEGIFLRRSSSKEAVLDKFLGNQRKNPITLVIQDKANFALESVRMLIGKRKSVDGKYNGIYDSCQHFAKFIFDKVAETKTWDFVTPVEFVSFVTLLTYLYNARVNCWKLWFIIIFVGVIVAVCGD